MVQDLSRVARSSNFAMSLVDLEESYDLGVSAHMRSAKPEFTGQVVGIRRGQGVDGGYNTEFFACPASKQHWPKSAACWSPATPRMGTPRTTPGFAVTP